MIFIHLILNIALAQSCANQAQDLGPYLFRRTEISADMGCFTTVKSATANNGPKRYFDFFKNGEMQIKTEIGSASDSKSIGFRNYFILPATETLDIKKLNDSTVQVQDTSGLNWNFDRNGNLKSENGCKMKTKSQLSWDGENTQQGQDGGFLIQSCPGSIVIDLGFRRSYDPKLDKTRTVSIKDSSGQSCELPISDIMSYPNRYSGVLKYKNSKDLYYFLSQKPGCKDLDLSPLNPTAPQNSKSENLQR